MINLGEVLRGAAVSESDTERRLENIDIDLIDEDPRNFYQLTGLDELASNIELCGLQQPLLVRPNPEAPNRVIIVSGHRRRAAIRKLVEEDGREDLRKIPCIREKQSGSSALQELRLIYANSDTRQLTSSEISKQAERVETLLYELKEEGVSFPGRMRDHVAEACKVSKTKIARLKVIREGLDEKWRPYYESGKLAESTAYALAREPGKYQEFLFDHEIKDDSDVRNIYESRVSAYIRKFKAVDKLVCKDSLNGEFPCKNRESKMAQVLKQSIWYDNTPCSKCCAKCTELAHCKNACPMLGDQIQNLKMEAKLKRQEEKDKQNSANQETVDRIRKVWDRFGAARSASGASVKQCYEAMGLYHTGQRTDDQVQSLENPGSKITPTTDLPFQYLMREHDAEKLTNLADLLGCSIDFLMGRDTAPTGWTEGSATPGKPCEVVAEFDFDGEKVKRLMVWDGKAFRFNRQSQAEVETRPARWVALPPDKEK